MKKYSIRLIRENINFDDINLDNIECTGKSLFNIMMTILFGGGSIGMLILNSEMLHSIQGVLAYIIINSIFILPFAYCILKIKNYYFSIKNDKIMYKNTFGITYEYKIYEIKNIKYMKAHHIEIFIIKMKNGKIIIISNYYSTNFKLLKLRFQKEKLI